MCLSLLCVHTKKFYTVREIQKKDPIRDFK